MPADSPESWPREGKAYLPVEANEFEGWLKAANESPSSASIVEAEYQARFAAGELVDTRGHWQVELQGKRAARLPLGGAALPIRAAKWRDGDAAAARLGWWPSAQNGDGPVRALEVPQSGVLEFEWNAPAHSTVDGAWSIPLDFPASARTTLVLELPPGKRPIVEAGAIVEAPASLREDGRWILALATSQPQTLRIEDAEGAGSALKSTTTSQSTRYAIHRGGVDLEATMEFSAPDSLPQSIVVVAPAWLSVVSVEGGDQPLSWRVTAQPNDRTQRVAIDLPAAKGNRSAPIVLRAWGPLVVGEARRLPQLVLEDFFWTAGEIELSVDEALELRDVKTSDCVQTAVDVVNPASLPARRMRFAAYESNAALEVDVRHRQSIGIVESGASLELGGSTARGRIVSLVRVERGQLHQLSAELRPDWVVDAVETIPADALREWYVDQTAEPHRLCLQMDSAIVPGKPLKVVATAHSSAAGIESMTAADLQPIAWQQLKSNATLLELQPAEQYDLEVHGTWNELSSDKLAADQRDLLSGVEGARLARVEGDAAATIRLVPKRIAYDATVQITAALLGDRCELSYEVVCTPDGGGIDHVLLFFAESPSAPVQWMDAESERPLKAEKMPTSDPRFGGLPAGGELWRLEFGRLYARPIKMAAQQSIPSTDRHRVPLVSLPDAASQQGRITIASSASEPPSIVAQNMTPAPLPLQSHAATPVKAPEIRAAYRFQPTRLYDSAAAPQLWLGPADAAGEAKLIVTDVNIVSRYAMDGAGAHRAVYRIDNQGVATFKLVFPRGVALATARIDGVPAVAESGRLLALALPPRKRDIVAELEFSSRGPALASGGRLLSPLPSSDCAMLTGEWTVKLPHGFAAIAPLVVDEGAQSSWRERLFGPLARRADRPFNPLDASDWNKLWITASSGLTSTAQAAGDVAPKVEIPTMPDGTITYRFPFGTTPLPFVVVAHRPATAAAALAVFMFCAVGAQLARCRVRTRLWLALATAIASLVVPALWAPLASAATLGFVAASIWHWMQPAASRTVPIAIIGAILVMPSSTFAAPATPKVESILVPVDGEGKPVGTKYYLTADFVRRLLSQSQATTESAGWLVESMRCDGQLVPGTGQNELVMGTWRLGFEIETLGRDITVNLPLVLAEADWPTTASIDGIPAAIEWHASGRGCSIAIDEPGQHRVSIAFVPRARSSATRREIELNLPPVVGAAVSVSTLRGIAGVSSEATPLVRQDESQHSVWKGELGSNGKLTLSWPSRLSLEVAEAKRQVTQVSLLNVTPSGIALELKLIQRETDVEWPESIQVAAETPWELVSNENWRAESVERLPDGKQLLVIPVPASQRSEPQLALRFVPAQSSPLGKLRPPGIEVTSLPLEGRWLAVECDPQLECDPSEPAGESARAFFSKLALALDSDDGRPPSVVVDVDQITADWHLEIRPAPQLSQFRNRLSLAAGQDHFRVNYRSDVAPQGADQFGVSYVVPEDFSLKDVIASEDGEPISLDWARVARDRVSVFFNRRVTGTYRLELIGQLAVPDDGLLSVPRIAPVNRLEASQIVAFYRDDNLLAEWRFQAEQPWVESGASLNNPFDKDTHFVQAFTVDPAAATGIQLAVDRSEPLLAGETLTRVVRGRNGWEAIWECNLSVERGTLDVLRLQMPETCAGPFDVTPASKLQVVASRDENQAVTLSYRLPQPVQAEETIHLEVRSPLAAPEGQPVAAPQIRLLAEGKRSDYLSLPIEGDGENLKWTKSGIEPSELPSTLIESPIPGEANATFRITGDDISVSLRPRPTRVDLASVRLAETVSFTGDGGERLHLTRFVISPAGLDQCDVRLPAGQTLIRASVDGQPALLRGLDENRVQVQLRHPVLPQMLDVITRSKPTGDAFDHVELAQPVLEQSGRPIPVDLSLWTLRGNFAGRRPQAIGGTPISASALASMRLDWLSSVSQASTRAALEVPAVDGYSWFVRWAAGLRAAGRLAEQAGETPSDAAPPTRVKQLANESRDDAASQSSAWIDQMAEFFRTTEMQFVEEVRNVDTALVPVRLEVGGGTGVHCFVSDGSNGPLVVEFESEGVNPAQARYIALGSLAVVAVAVVWLARSPRALELAVGWPEAWGVAIGLAGWAWLRPSALGLAIAVVSLGLFVRRIQRERKSPRHDSSKLPNSIPEELA